jgi:hypothetical protein
MESTYNLRTLTNGKSVEDIAAGIEAAAIAIQSGMTPNEIAQVLTNGGISIAEIQAAVAGDIDSKWSAIQALVDSSLVFETKAQLDASIPTADANGRYPLAKVWRDVEANNGIYGYYAGAWVKSEYDPIKHTDNTYTKALKTLLAPASFINLSNKAIISTNAETGVSARFNYYGESLGAPNIDVSGMFASLRLTNVTGSSYPTDASDTNVFETSPRLELFVDGVLVINRVLQRLGDTEVWYYGADDIVASNVSEVKVYATPKSGVNFTFEECYIINANVAPFTEVTNRNKAIAASEATTTYAIAAAKKQLADKILLSLLGRYGSDNNVLTKTTHTSSGIGTNQSISERTGLSTSCNGLFACMNLSIADSGYPIDSSDTTYFSYRPRVQIYAGSTWYTRYLERLGNTNAWYVQDESLVLTNISIIKVETRAQEGVIITSDNITVLLDGGYPNVEYLARNTAISNAQTELKKNLIKSGVEGALSGNLLKNTQGRAVKTTDEYTYVWLITNITKVMTKLSAAVKLTVHSGIYPTSASATKLKAEVFEGSSLKATTYLSRLDGTDIWYCLDVPVNAPTTTHTILKIAVDVLNIGDDYELSGAVASNGGVPLYGLGASLDIKTEMAQGFINATSYADTKHAEAQAYVDSKFSSVPSNKPRTALEALALAKSRRLDFVMIGDSNQAMDGGGFSLGLLKALRDAYGVYATGVGKNVSYLQNMAFVDHTGAPDEVEAIWSEYGAIPYNYIADGTFSSAQNGCLVQKDYFDVNASLRAHFCWISLDNGSGSFKPGIRYGESPWSVLVMGDLVSTNKGEYAKQLTTLDIPAGTRNVSLEAKFYVPQQSVITGPFAGAFARVENLDMHNGVSVHTLYASGGQSLWDMASTLLLYPDHQLANLFSEYRRLQIADGYDPIVVFYINSGLNDQNETSTPSWGWRKSTMPASAEAYIDNLDSITKRISDIWQKNKWPIDELFFLFVPSHPYSTPDDSDLLAYRMAAFSYAQNRVNCSMVDFSNLISHDEMFEHEYYRSENTDFYHLIEAGYADLAARIVSLVQARE